MPLDTDDPPKANGNVTGNQSIYDYSDTESYLEALGTGEIQKLEFDIKNIGGIVECEFSISPGVSVLVGQNATNRTSTLRGIGAAIGADTGTIRAGVDIATAAVDVVGTADTTSLEREYHRVGSDSVQTSFSAMPELKQPGVEALTDFAMLLEDNRVRQAIRRDGDLYDTLMAPVDTDAIQLKIDTLQHKRSDIDTEIERVESEQERLPRLEEREQSVQEDIDEMRSELLSKREQLQDLQQEAEDSDDNDELAEQRETILEELQDSRQDHNWTESEIDREQQRIEELKEQQDDIETELDMISVDSEARDDLETQISGLQDRYAVVDNTYESLLTIKEYNDEILKGDIEIDQFITESGAGSGLDLDSSSQQINCWTCGSEVERQMIETRNSEIQQLISEKDEERREIKSELDDLKDDLADIEAKADKREELRSRLDDIQSEITTRKQRVTNLKSQLDDLETTISEKEDELAELDDASTDDDTDDTVESEITTVSQEIGELKGAIDQREDDLEEIQTEIADIEDSVAGLPFLQNKRDELTEQIEELRGAIDAKEQALVDRFNEHMDELLDELAYDNLARVWLERKTADDETEFVLHIIREGEAVYEDRVSNLSESEREVVGLMAAVAGHAVHDVGNIFPMIVLDSLEAIDAVRISRLIEYLSEQVDFLVLALLEEDAAALPEEYTRAAPCN